MAASRPAFQIGRLTRPSLAHSDGTLVARELLLPSTTNAVDYSTLHRRRTVSCVPMVRVAQSGVCEVIQGHPVWCRDDCYFIAAV